ncbi:hypothetical protein CGZ11_04760 [Salmonella enterica]|uniref:Uncharacterized protein n=1 Tax=Salmonella enterica TaxID=28901 RepID=A0A3J8SZ24_SALER|nr:hypothetical protein [Salmonella enterica]EAU5128620.1 hypothetical protein [Salmonella enterica subsp. enterica serovar Oranienburg]OIV03726.1 hypothetical protein APP86_03880 [Salmonella enterica subsp. houtenae]EAO3201995.1 hypothetical protein [Salmonella enterica]EAX0786921.1 hypothetical protein [Salmonella enterica]
MNNRPSSVSASPKKHAPNGKTPGVVVSLVGEFVGKTSQASDGVTRRFRVDSHCIAGGCAGETITLCAKNLHVAAIYAVPDRVTVELREVYVVNKGTHSYASANYNFTTDYEPKKSEKRSQKKSRRNQQKRASVTVKTPKVKPVRGKCK